MSYNLAVFLQFISRGECLLFGGIQNCGRWHRSLDVCCRIGLESQSYLAKGDGQYTGYALTALYLQMPLLNIFLTQASNQCNMSEKKRKRYEEKPDGRPSKKIASQAPSQNIKVSVIEDGDNWAPVLGACSLSL